MVFVTKFRVVNYGSRLESIAENIMYIKEKGLSNMCNIAHVKETKISNFLLKNYNYLIKNYIFNIKRSSSNANLLL